MSLPLPPSVNVLERGWLSSNNVLFDDGEAMSLVDTGYALHAEQTALLVDRMRGARPLTRIFNTHLHSDHVGGNALLKARHGASITMPAGLAAAVAAWDEDALTYAPTGQQCPRFMYDGLLHDGDIIDLGGLPWRVLAAPGHDPHMVMLLQTDHGVLISADALWENGFGAIFPEIEGESGFAEQRAALALIESHAPRLVIPGHGAPFSDVAAAVQRSHARLDALSSSRERNARHVARVLIKFWLMQVRRTDRRTLLEWSARARYFPLIHTRYFGGESFADMIDRAIDELVSAGAAARSSMAGRGEPHSNDETISNID